MLLLAVVAVMLVTLIGASQAAPSREAVTLRIGVGTFMGETLDPILGSNARKFYLPAMYDYLVMVDTEAKYRPDLSVANKWEGSTDHKTWTFWIRSGIKFHNGDKLTPEDVKFSLERAVSKQATSTFTGRLRKYLDRVEVTGNKVVVHLKKADPFFYYWMSNEVGTESLITSKRYIEDIGTENFNRKPLGSGPYKFVEQVVGSHIKFEAVDYPHWRVGVPKFKYLEFYVIPEESVRIAMLKTGELDITQPGSEYIEELRGLGLNLFPRGGTMSIGAYFTGAGKPNCPFSDIRVRKAFNLAINREEIIRTLFQGLGKKSDSLILTPMSLGYRSYGPYPYDLEQAKRLLAEAGYPQGKGLKVDVYAYTFSGIPEGPTMMEAIAGYWSALGVNINIIKGDYMVFRTPMANDSLRNSASVGYTTREFRRFSTSLYNFWWGTGTAKAAHLNSPELNALIAKANAEDDLEKYAVLEAKLDRFHYDNFLGIPIIVKNVYFAASKKVRKWNPGLLYYDWNLDDLISSK
jgi:peptide/nickel transport system substrate-binding protein